MKVNSSTRPLQLREKLLTQGTEQLSDAELLAVFISSGTKKKYLFTAS